MKRRILAVLLAFSFVLGCMSPVTASAAAKKRYRLTKITVSTGGSTTDKIVVSYNESSHTVKEKEYDSDGKLSETGNLKYDAAGNLSSIRITDETEKYSYTILCEYDGQHRLTKRSLQKPDGTTFWQSLLSFDAQYDAAGNPTEITHYQNDGSVMFSWSYSYTYDDSGRIIRTDIRYSGSGTSTNGTDSSCYALSTYEDGKLVRMDAYSTSGAAQGYTLYQYDAKGRKTAETGYSMDGTATSSKSWKYNSKGLLTYESAGTQGGSQNSYKYQYDSHGNRVKQIWTTQSANGTTSTQTTKYTYKAVTSKWVPEIWNVSSGAKYQ